jgi:2-polyprenyl-3-methyl-5-hydroxy-6-metoxy-1,4-benzoquinol methylase
MKKLGLKIADALSVLWRLLPQKLRLVLLKGLFVLESRGGDTGAGLARLFALQDALEHVVNERAMVHGKGEHPKHRLTNYHAFFVSRVRDGEGVLDVGCGYGAVARSVARAHPTARIVGADYDKGRLSQARASANPPNLSFVETDATKAVPPGPWDVVILSNVLEHITDRVGFLAALVAKTQAGRFLIRVPHFERDWKMAMRRDVGANYYSDPDHKIEPTESEFRDEVTRAGLVIDELLTPWGEIWSTLHPAQRSGS